MNRAQSRLLESLEPRRLLAWSAAAQVMDQDSAATFFPNINGQGVTIAVMDTGIDYNHPQLGGGFGAGKKVKAGYDFVNDDNDPMDTAGHGTNNAGLIAASPYELNGTQYAGIAPNAELVALRVSSGGDVVTYQTIERALQWIISNHAQHNISIVNFSFGSGRFTNFETNATISDELKTIADLGILFVSPSGGATSLGAGAEGIMYPGADPNVVAVGSVSTSDTLSSFTNRGKLVDILAPGEQLQTTALNGTFTNVTDGSYSPPLIAGAAALVKQVDPTFKARDIMSILSASGTAIADGNLQHPRLDVDNAILLAQKRATGPANDPGANGFTNDIAIDKFGVAHFTYYDPDAKTMRYAIRSTSAAWSHLQSIDTSGEDAGAHLSIAVDSLGRPSIAYYDGTNGDLDFARWDGAAWKKSALDTKNTTGQLPSLAFDANDNAIVAYYRKTSGDLRVMRFLNGQWTRTEPDTLGNTGLFPSLDVSKSGQIGVAYADGTNGDLKYAQWNGSAWNVELVDNLDTVAYISHAFDNNNNPAISYYHALAADLKFAHKTGGTWNKETVTSKGAVGLYTSLWFDELNKANIIYYNRKSNGLFRLNGGLANWTADTLTLLGGAGAVATPTIDGTAAVYSWWNPNDNKLHTGDVT